MLVSACSQEAWKFLHNKKYDFLPYNSSVKQINYFSKFIQCLVHFNVEGSVIGIIL